LQHAVAAGHAAGEPESALSEEQGACQLADPEKFQSNQWLGQGAPGSTYVFFVHSRTRCRRERFPVNGLRAFAPNIFFRQRMRLRSPRLVVRRRRNRLSISHGDMMCKLIQPLPMADLVRDISLAFMRVHVLHHAAHERVFGVGMMEELARHGYEIGPSTLYPLLHRLESDGLLACEPELVEGKIRKYYVITDSGRTALNAIQEKMAELVREALSHAGAHASSEQAG
jgi:DNA-binding PadR family transcriptional regulator